MSEATSGNKREAGPGFREIYHVEINLSRHSGMRLLAQARNDGGYGFAFSRRHDVPEL
jgi:hypothetical protein